MDNEDRLITEWRKIIQAEARRAAEEILGSSIGAIDTARARTAELADQTAALLAKSQGLATLIEAATKAPAETLLASADVMMLGKFDHPSAEPQLCPFDAELSVSSENGRGGRTRDMIRLYPMGGVLDRRDHTVLLLFFPLGGAWK